jgi:anaerobic selenocysteine-containing dehydrogenase
MEKTKKGFCMFCISECGILAEIRNNKILKIHPDPDDPVSRGYVCEKSQKIPNFQYHKDRISSPLKRVNGQFIPISWEQALEEIALRIKSVIEKDRADRIFYMPPLSPNFNSNTLYCFELMSRIGSQFMANIFSVEKMYAVMTMNMVYMRPVFPDVENSQTLVVFGQNPWNTNPWPRTRITLNDIKLDSTRQLIVIDPVDSETSKIADIHIKLKSGTDSWFILLLIKEMIDKKYINYDFLEKNVIQYKKILASIDNINIAEYLEICEIEYIAVENLAKIISSSKSVSYVSGNGICHGLYPLASYYLLSILPLITGQIDSPGNLIHGPSLAVSQPYFNKNKTPFTKKAQLYGIMPAGEVIENLYVNDDKKFDIIITDNCNPVERYPETDRVIDQFNHMDLHIALDSFHTATTARADYILPTPTYLERYECTNMVNPNFGIIQLTDPLLTPIDNVREARDIYEDLINRLDLIDHEDKDMMIKLHSEDRQLFLSTMIDRFNLANNTTLQIIQKTEGKRFLTPLHTMVWWQLLLYSIRYNLSLNDAIIKADTQMDELLKKKNLKFNTGEKDQINKYNMHDDFFVHILRLNPNRLKLEPNQFVLYSGYRERGNLNLIVENLNQQVVEISRLDADRLDLSDNTLIEVRSEKSKIILPCKINDNIPPNVIRIPNGVNINYLTNSKTQDYHHPEYKFVKVTITKVHKLLDEIL